MITADKLTLLINMPSAMLTMGIKQAGHKNGPQFTNAKFLGLTNAGEFCYQCTYISDEAERLAKVFVKYDLADDKITIDY